MAGDVPVGIAVLEVCCEKRCRSIHFDKNVCYRIFILLITFLCYTAYHLSRKPLSVVKNVLATNCSTQPLPADVMWPVQVNDYWCNWPPFNIPNADELLGTLDSCFLFSYAFAMFFSGSIAERVNLRYYLSFGMIFSGISVYLFGVAYSYNIHGVWYYVAVMVFGGIVQTTGWPSVVTIVSNWFGKGRRGFIFGVWNSHTSVGNILGSLIAGAFVSSNWGLSFMIPGVIMAVMGFLVFLFLIVYPEDVGCSPPDHHSQRQTVKVRKKIHSSEDEDFDNNQFVSGSSFLWKSNANVMRCSPALRSVRTVDSQSFKSLLSSKHDKLSEEEKPILPPSESANLPSTTKAVKFCDAIHIPGVLEFAWCLFFAKLVSYTFLYWLPRYISISTSFTAEEAANLSTLFDVGGIVGGIVAGLISDHTGASATTCISMLFFAVPMLFLYETFGNYNLPTNIGLLMVCGALVNGPYALITTAVSAELGTHRSLSGNSKALATVAAIIDGTGSLGAALGPLLAGVISTTGWQNVFVMLMVANVLAMLLLSRLAVKEIISYRQRIGDKKHYMVA